jgi:hypothetical protein
VALLFFIGVTLERVKSRIQTYFFAVVCWVAVGTGLMAIVISNGLFTINTFAGLEFQWQWDRIIFIYVTTLLAILSGMMTSTTEIKKIIIYLNSNVFS